MSMEEVSWSLWEKTGPLPLPWMFTDGELSSTHYCVHSTFVVLSLCSTLHGAQATRSQPSLLHYRPGPPVSTAQCNSSRDRSRVQGGLSTLGS